MNNAQDKPIQLCENSQLVELIYGLSPLRVRFRFRCATLAPNYRLSQNSSYFSMASYDFARLLQSALAQACAVYSLKGGYTITLRLISSIWDWASAMTESRISTPAPWLTKFRNCFRPKTIDSMRFRHARTSSKESYPV